MIESGVIVVIDGSEHRIGQFGLSDLVALERHFGVSSATFGGENGEGMRMEHMLFLVHRRLVRTGAIAPCAFDDDFMDRIEKLDAVEAESGVDPTVQAPQPA